MKFSYMSPCAQVVSLEFYTEMELSVISLCIFSALITVTKLLSQMFAPIYTATSSMGEFLLHLYYHQHLLRLDSQIFSHFRWV